MRARTDLGLKFHSGNEASERVFTQAFVGRVQEMEQLENWLQSSSACSCILSISGIGGVGKTTLLTQFAHICRNSSVRIIWLDGRTFARQPSDFLQGIDMILEHEYGIIRDPEVPVMTHIMDAFDNEPTVVLIDNSEDVYLIEGWLLSSYIPQLPQTRHLMIFSSRQGLPVQWTSNPSIGKPIVTMALDVFSADEAMEYLLCRSVPSHTAEALALKTQGHPLSLALGVDVFHVQGQTNIDGTILHISNLINVDILREVTTPSVYQALRVLSILPIATRTEIDALMYPQLTSEEFRILTSLSFVRTSSQGFALHDVVSRVVREDFRDRLPERFASLCKLAMSYMVHQFSRSNRGTQIQIASHFLRLYLEVVPVNHSYTDFSSTPKTGEYKPFRPSDLPHLHRILEGAMLRATWQCELIVPGSHHKLLDDVASYHPESIRVVRSETGVPLAMGVGVWLHSTSLALLENYAPRFAHEVLVGEIPRLKSFHSEDADSFAILLSAVDMEHQVYRPETLGVLSFMDWYALVCTGARSIIATADPVFQQFIVQFGSREITELQPESGESSIRVLEWDFRHEQFPVWANTMIQQIENRMILPSDASQSPGLDVVANIEDAEVKEALNHLYRIPKLDQAPLARKLGISGVDLQRQIRSLLYDSPPKLPVTERDQMVLQAYCSNGDKDRARLAESLNVSRTTLYRYTRSAIANLASALMNSCHH